jgi:hypothetical protein
MRWPVFLSAILIESSTLYGQQDTWHGPNNGSWFTASNWSSGVPDKSTNAVVDFGNTAQIPFLEGPSFATAATLTIGETKDSTVQLLGFLGSKGADVPVTVINSKAWNV